MSKYNIFPKPLKGGQFAFPLVLDETNTSNILNLLNSGIELENVAITGGTIDGVTIGQNGPIDANFANINVSGNTNVNNVVFPGGSNIVEVGGDLVLNASTPSNSVTTPNPVEINNNVIISGSLTVMGPSAVTFTTTPFGLTTERLTPAIGSVVNPSALYGITMLVFTDTASAASTGTLVVPATGSFIKVITIINMPLGKEFNLTINNLLDPGTQTIANTVVNFLYSGQSIMLLYSLIDDCYIFLPGGSV